MSAIRAVPNSTYVGNSDIRSDLNDYQTATADTRTYRVDPDVPLTLIQKLDRSNRAIQAIDATIRALEDSLATLIEGSPAWEETQAQLKKAQKEQSDLVAENAQLSTEWIRKIQENEYQCRDCHPGINSENGGNPEHDLISPLFRNP